MFHVGQKVVCVDARTPSYQAYSSFEKCSEGSIYTVAAISMEYHFLCIQLAELSPWAADGREAWHRAMRFRPVIERKTDISIFKKMLTPAPKRAREFQNS